MIIHQDATPKKAASLPSRRTRKRSDWNFRIWIPDRIEEKILYHETPENHEKDRCPEAAASAVALFRVGGS